jgi:hypothetical protein
LDVLHSTDIFEEFQAYLLKFIKPIYKRLQEEEEEDDNAADM